MSRINLRVPSDMSKNIDEIRDKLYNKSRKTSGVRGVNLKIPVKLKINNLESVTVLDTTVNTPSTEIQKKKIASQRAFKIKKCKKNPRKFSKKSLKYNKTSLFNIKK